MDIISLALACDLTRVCSLQFSTATSQVTHKWLGTNQTDTHHNYSHNGPTSFYSLAGMCVGSYDNMGHCTAYSDIYSPTNTNLYQNLSQQEAIDQFYATQVAYLSQKLNAMTGANRGSLLDQSVVCWGNELDMGAAHNHDDTPFVLVGGANGQLKTGNLVTFPLDPARQLQPQHAAQGRPLPQRPPAHARQGHGDPTDKPSANPSFCTGPITEILNG